MCPLRVWAAVKWEPVWVNLHGNHWCNLWPCDDRFPDGKISTFFCLFVPFKGVSNRTYFCVHSSILYSFSFSRWFFRVTFFSLNPRIYKQRNRRHGVLVRSSLQCTHNPLNPTQRNHQHLHLHQNQRKFIYFLYMYKNNLNLYMYVYLSPGPWWYTPISHVYKCHIALIQHFNVYFNYNDPAHGIF